MTLGIAMLMLRLTGPADAVDVEIDAPPEEAARLEEAVEQAAQEQVAPPPAQGTAPPKVHIVRQPKRVSIIVIDPATNTATVREVPLEGELTEVASQEVGQIVAEALAAYAEATAASAAEPPSPTPAPAPVTEPPVEDVGPIEAVPDPDPDPAPEPPPSPTDAFGRGGFVGLGIGPGLHIVQGNLITRPTLLTALTLGYSTDLARDRTYKRRSSPHATFAFRFGTDSLFSDAGSVTFFDLWARIRLGSVTGRNFTYAAGGMGASIVDLRIEGDEASSGRDVRFGGSFGMGSQWIVTGRHALGFELDFAPYQMFRAVRMHLELAYGFYF